MLMKLPNGNWIDPLLVGAIEYSRSAKFGSLEAPAGVRIYTKDGDKLFSQFIPYSSDEAAYSETQRLGDLVNHYIEKHREEISGKS